MRKKIRVWDLLTGRGVREWAQAPEGEPDDGYRWLAGDVAFLADGRLIVGQAGGVRLLDPRTGANEWAWKLPPTDVAMVAASADGRARPRVRVPEAVAAANWTETARSSSSISRRAGAAASAPTGRGSALWPSTRPAPSS